MVRSISATILCLYSLTLAQRCAADEEHIAFEMVAIQATNEGRDTPVFGENLGDLKKTLSELPYDTYKHLVTTKVSVAYHEEARIKIDERYTLIVKPMGREQDGRITVETRIEAVEADKKKPPVNALKATSMMVPGDHLKLHGLKLETGKLVLVLTARV